MVALGARWPLLCPPFVLYIGKTWTSHGPNLVQLTFQVISAKKIKKFEKPMLTLNLGTVVTFGAMRPPLCPPFVLYIGKT